MSADPGSPGTIGAFQRTAWTAHADRIDLVRPARPARPVTVAALPSPISIDLARTAVVVVDMQNDFCHPDGWLASLGVDISPTRRPIPVLGEHLPTLRGADVPVVWLNWGARADRANLPPNVLHVYDPDGSGAGIGSPIATGAPVLERGSWGAAVVDELKREPGDVWIDKHRMSGFWDTELDSTLRNLGVDTLLLGGVNADQCVLATLIDAACAGYDTVLLEDASATTSPVYCWDATIYNVRQCFGFTSLLAAIGDAVAADGAA